MSNIEPRYAHVPRLAAGSAESIEHLQDEGFVVIASALDTDAAAHALSLTWDWLEGLGTGIDRYTLPPVPELTAERRALVG